MAEMTSHERFKRMFEHRQADRVPITDSPWTTTLERWRREGMPEEADWVDYFGLDHVVTIHLDVSPRYEKKVVEQTDEYVTTTTEWGSTIRNWTHATSTPEFVAPGIPDPVAWAQAKQRMTPTRDRVDWDRLQANYRTWREKGCWVQAALYFGFDVTHARMVGTERFLIALIDQPDWCVDIFNHCLDMSLALAEMVWQAGYAFDAVRWPDDLGYKHNLFFSIPMYRRLLKPVHKRAVDWAHAHGVYAHLHSCGDVRPLIPEFLDIGMDALNPLEVKAGMDPVAIKAAYGDRLVLHGGINAVLWDDTEAIEAEMRKVVPAVKKGGGYIFSSDHSIPDTVSLENFRRIVALAKELGKY